MATTRDVIYRALKEIRIIAPGEDPEAADTSDALAKLNGIMHSLVNEGLTYTHTDLTLNDAFPFADELIEPAVMWLAGNLAGIFDLELTQKQYIDAMNGEEAIFAAYLTVPDSSFDKGVYTLPSSRRYGSIY